MEARPFSVKVAQFIAAEANTKTPAEVCAFAGSAATMALQTIVISLMVSQFEPGSKPGEDYLKVVYEAALKDATERWHKSDLKEQRAAGRI